MTRLTLPGVAAAVGLIAVAVATGETMTLRPKRAVAAGAYHACVVSSAGAVRCWGANEEGQLGNGTTTDSSVPVQVVGLEHGVASVSLGYDSGCALMVSGEIKCWGRYGDLRIGGGPPGKRLTPVDVPNPPSGVVSISVGKNLACALTGSGGVYCWGGNEQGQLGGGTAAKQSLSPVAVPGLPRVAAIAAAKNFTCALTAGSVKCWGLNDHGQLGDGTTENRAAPVQAVGLSWGVLAISATGDFACALTSPSTAKCWGKNDHGQLGNGSVTDSHVPVAVRAPGQHLVAITAGANHACTLSITGVVRCWGRNDHGELGDGTTVERHVPVTVRGLGPGVVSVRAAASGHYVCALTRYGAVKCWGRNQYGQLGNGSTTDLHVPTKILTVP